MIKQFLSLLIMFFSRKIKREEERHRRVTKQIEEQHRAIKTADINKLNALIARRKRLHK